MESSKSSAFIEKFTGKNFPTWQTKLRLILMKDGVWNVVCGKDKKPQSDEKKILHWENLNDKALSLIGLGLGDEVIHHLDFDSTAQELWEKFEGLFGNKVINSKVFLRQEFFKLQMKHEDSLLTHLNHMESLITQLAALKAPVGDDDQVAVLLTSIEEIPKYREIIPALRVASMSYHDMVAMLLDHERRHIDTPDANALFSKGRFPKGKGNFKPFKCTYCGKLGHTEDRCFQKLAKQQSKDHANLVGTVSNEDEDDADTSTPIHALTAHIQDLSLDEEVYAPDDLDFVF